MDRDLEAALASLQARMERDRLRLFRTDLGRRICLASPLLVDACRSGELDEAAWRLVPPRSWPERAIIRTVVRGRAIEGQRSPLSVRSYDLETSRLVTEEEHLMLRITVRSAHMSLRLGAVGIRTSDRGGRLFLPGMLSLAERESLVGEPLDRAFPHPIVNRRRYMVVAADQDVNSIQTLIDFAVPPLEWRLPWARPWLIYDRSGP